jgi:YidC/Oxa1 family membrane protein insertase
MDQRMLLAVALSILVMIAFYAIFPPQAPKKPVPPAPQAEAQPPVPKAAARGESAPAPRTPEAAPAGPAQRIRVETPRYVAEIDTGGGILVSLTLNDYAVAVPQIDWGDVIPPLRAYLSKPEIDPGARVEMVRRELPAPGTLGVRFVDNPTLTAEADHALFSADRERIVLSAQSAPETIVLTGHTLSGITLRKSMTFDPSSYVIRYGAAVINYGERAISLRVQHLFGEGSVPVHAESSSYSHVGPIYRADGSLETEDVEDVAPALIMRDLNWMGIAEPYFLAAARAESTISHGFYEAERNPDERAVQKWLARYGMELPVVSLEPNKQIESAFRLYFGPKQGDELKKFGDSLEDALDMTLEALAKPLLAMLRWFYGFAGNYGIAIILLTIVVRVALFPLTYKGMVSMKRMQKLQPKMMALREKYKNDRERMNRETMGLYKRYKVNPLGGCLPILLQLPIFFALYSALSSAIELRHTPFFGWITDLSAMDGLFVLPILMGGSMVIQQRLTPTTVDPVQAKILMWMPVIFTLFMFTFPSGLTLYWFTSNILSILQQLVINRVQVPELVEQKT